MYKYAETARRYQRRVQKNKTVTVRCGKENGVSVSSRMQAGVNIATGAVCVTCALWHGGRAIYPATMEVNEVPQTPRNTSPNAYTVTYIYHDGEKHMAEIDALTKDEAVCRVLATIPVATLRNIWACPKPKGHLKFSELFNEVV